MNNEQVPAENAQKPEPPNQLEKIFATLKEWRDNLLILVGIFYVAGYLMWAWYAFNNNLGLQPALQFQYIVAGIPVVIGLIIVYTAWKSLNIWNNKLETEQTWFWVFLHRIFQTIAFFGIVGIIYSTMGPSVAISGVIGFVLYNLYISEETSLAYMRLVQLVSITPYSKLSNREQKTRSGWMLLVFALIVLVFLNQDLIDSFLFFRLLKKFPQDVVMSWTVLTLAIVFLFDEKALSYFFFASFVKFYRVFYFIVFVVAFAILVLPIYNDNVYTKLPQEFGGVSPRCAYLDIKTENLSSDTHQTLFGTTRDDSTPPVLRTVQLDILFTSTSVLMARPHTDTGQQGVVYEIPRSNVQSITWCK